MALFYIKKTDMFSKEEVKALKSEFWTEFDNYCYTTSQKKPKWLLNNTGIKNVSLMFEISETNAKVLIEVGHKNESRRVDVFEWIQSYKVVIEEGFNEPLVWDYIYTRDNGKEVGRIYIQLNNVSQYNKETWPTIFKFYQTNMQKLETNFLEIKDFLRKNM